MAILGPLSRLSLGGMFLENYRPVDLRSPRPYAADQQMYRAADPGSQWESGALPPP